MEDYMYKLEIDLTYSCTLRCLNCNRNICKASGDARHEVTASQIKKLIKQSISNNYIWKQIRIMGGEPTIHPQFDEIVGLIVEYKKKHNRELVIKLSTNGYTKFTKYKINWIKDNYHEIEVQNSDKTNNIQLEFDYANIAPVDALKNKVDYTKACMIPKRCGIGFNYSGFYCCGVGAAIARIFGYKIGIKEVGGITQEKLASMYNLLCSKCGHFLPIKVRSDIMENLMSPIWIKAYKRYSNRTFELDRF